MTFENPSGDAVPPAQPYPIPGQPYPGQGQPYPGQGQPYPGQPYPGQQYPPQQYPGQQYPAQQYPNQQYPNQQYPGPADQQYPAPQYPDPSGQSWGAQPQPPQQQQPWGQPQQPQQPWGVPTPGFAPPPGPKKSRTGLIIGGAVVVVLALIGGVYAATSSSGNKPAADVAPTDSATAASSPSAPATSAAPTQTSAAAGTLKVVVPTSAGGLKLMTGTSGEAVTNAMKKADASDSMYSSALFGAYAKSSGKGYFSNLTLIPVADSSELRDAAGDASSFISEVTDQSGLTDVSVESASVSDGAIACGLDKASNITLRMCMWIDSTEYGLGAYPESVSNAQAAAYSNALWQASEKS